ncbi:MAG: poly(3-hydroxybutyrate) depolymerase, partial [Beggiatoa sp.]|nr:poly(3-hydroxybutyrate) depolymerase [Beggiatoa sp.]
MKHDRNTKRYLWFSGLVALAVVLCAPLPARAADPLPAYGADLSQTSVSGLSSGAFMTAQFHVVHSSTLVGAGVIAGGPFYCAGSYQSLSYLEAATTICMHPFGPGPDGNELYAKAEEFARSGRIDPVADLADDRVYLFSGEADDVVTTEVVDQTLAFYQAAGVSAANIKYVKTVDAGHAITTNNSADSSCAVTKPPFINDCDFVQSHELLRHVYGTLNPPAPNSSGRILIFDQREFIDSDRSSMSDSGYAYVPKSCAEDRCRVHVAFHGCLQGAAQIGDRYYTTTGYNEIADTNAMIVLYPQVQVSDPIP